MDCRAWGGSGDGVLGEMEGGGEEGKGEEVGKRGRARSFLLSFFMI